MATKNLTAELYDNIVLTKYSELSNDTDWLKSGYRFSGWGEKSDSTVVKYKDGQVIQANKNMSLYAIWEKDVDPEPEQKYVELDYIQSDGNAYIDTGIIPDYDCVFEIQANVIHSDPTYANAWFGAESKTGNEIILLETNDRNQPIEQHNMQAVFGQYINNIYENEFDSFHRYSLGKDNFKVDGNVKASSIYEPYPDKFERTIHIFRMNADAKGTYYQRTYPIKYTKIKNFKILKNDNVLINLIPVKYNDGIQDIICMYDTISKKFFDNAGSSGSFKGPQ